MKLFKRKESIVPGVYLSPLSGEQLAEAQKKKTVLLWASCVFFAAAIFISPSFFNVPTPNINQNITFMYIAVLIYLAGIAASFAVLVSGRKKQKIRNSVDAKDAPRYGFKKFTYFSYEFFTVSRIGGLAVQIAAAVLDFSFLTALLAAFMAVSAVLAVLSRQVLWKANQSAEFKPEKSADDGKGDFYT